MMVCQCSVCTSHINRFPLRRDIIKCEQSNDVTSAALSDRSHHYPSDTWNGLEIQGPHSIANSCSEPYSGAVKTTLGREQLHKQTVAVIRAAFFIPPQALLSPDYCSSSFIPLTVKAFNNTRLGETAAPCRHHRRVQWEYGVRFVCIWYKVHLHTEIRMSTGAGTERRLQCPACILEEVWVILSSEYIFKVLVKMLCTTLLSSKSNSVSASSYTCRIGQNWRTHPCKRQRIKKKKKTCSGEDQRLKGAKWEFEVVGQTGLSQ